MNTSIRNLYSTLLHNGHIQQKIYKRIDKVTDLYKIVEQISFVQVGKIQEQKAELDGVKRAEAKP